jgi:hypothetical protein
MGAVAEKIAAERTTTAALIGRRARNNKPD